MAAIDGNVEMIQICKAGFGYMLMIMRIDDDQVFKICIEFFHFYIGNYLEKQQNNQLSCNFKNYSPSLQAIYK